MRAATDWRNESAADVGWGNWEAEERRDARRAAPGGSCYRHRFAPDGRGGGRCACGETLSPEEL